MNIYKRIIANLSKKMLALVLCCLCLVASVPIYAFISVAEEPSINDADYMIQTDIENTDISSVPDNNEPVTKDTDLIGSKQTETDEFLAPADAEDNEVSLFNLDIPEENNDNNRSDIESNLNDNSDSSSQNSTDDTEKSDSEIPQPPNDDALTESEPNTDNEKNSDVEYPANTIIDDNCSENSILIEMNANNAALGNNVVNPVVKEYLDALDIISLKIQALDITDENFESAFMEISEELDMLQEDIQKSLYNGEITTEEYEYIITIITDAIMLIMPIDIVAEPVSPLADIDPDATFINVAKTFSGIKKEQIPEEFNITISDGGEKYVLNSSNRILPDISSENQITWKWKLPIGVGTYTVSESGYEIDNYNVTTTGTGNIKVEAGLFNVTSEIEHKCSQRDWPVSIIAGDNVMFAAALTQGGCIVISQYSLSASQRLKVSQAILGGNWKEPVNFYSIEKNENGPYTVSGRQLEYIPSESIVRLSKTSDWTHVATVKFNIESASAPDINIVNTYTPKAYDLTVGKTVSGNDANAEKGFDFTVTYAGTDKTFKLKDGELNILEKIPVGATVTISEDPGGYTYSLLSITDGVQQTALESGNGIQFTMPSKDVEVVFNNEKNAFNLTITKTVSGNMADVNKEFQFSVDYGTDTPSTFNLKNDGKKIFEKIPAGTVIQITENPDGYSYSLVSITEGFETIRLENGLRFTMPENNVEVVIDNSKNVLIDTGIILDSMPYIIILCLAVVGIVSMIKNRKSRYDE